MKACFGGNGYYPFGMIMPGRTYSNDNSYRYGFNGKEKDKDISSVTAYDYGFRIYNPGLGRFLSVDPLINSYPWYTPYQFAGNIPIWAIDMDGAEPVGYGEREVKGKLGFSWLLKTEDERVKYNFMGGDRSYTFFVIDAHGNGYKVMRQETEKLGWANHIFKQYQYYYIDPDVNNPQRTGYYSIMHAGTGITTVEGALVPFETQGQSDARIGKGVGNIILGALAIGLVSPFVASAAVTSAPYAINAARFAWQTGSTGARIGGRFASWAVKQFGRTFAKETIKEVASNWRDISKVDGFDIITNTLASKFEVGWGAKMAVEGLNGAVDVSWKNGYQVIGGNGNHGKGFDAAGIDIMFGSINVAVDASLNRKLPIRIITASVDQIKAGLNEYLEPDTKKKF